MKTLNFKYVITSSEKLSLDSPLELGLDPAREHIAYVWPTNGSISGTWGICFNCRFNVSNKLSWTTFSWLCAPSTAAANFSFFVFLFRCFFFSLSGDMSGGGVWPSSICPSGASMIFWGSNTPGGVWSIGPGKPVAICCAAASSLLFLRFFEGPSGFFLFCFLASSSSFLRLSYSTFLASKIRKVLCWRRLLQNSLNSLSNLHYFFQLITLNKMQYQSHLLFISWGKPAYWTCINQWATPN